MSLKDKSLLIFAILIILVGSVNAEELNDTIAIENTDLSQNTLETISVNDNINNNTNTQNNFQVAQTNEDNETNNIENIATNNIENNTINSVATLTPINHTFEGIQAAIDLATTGDTIKLSGTYNGNGKGIEVTKNLTFIGENQATLDAKTLSRVMYICQNVVATFINITFKNGYLTGNGGAFVIAGGASGTFTGCEISGNTATDAGGVYIDGSGTFTDCNFTDNSGNYNGGAVLVATGFSKFINCNFIDNTAKAKGGAIITGTNSAVTITNCNFTNNVADTTGGAVSLGGSGAFTNCDFTGNTAKGSVGAVYITGRSGSFTNCNFINNTAALSNSGAVMIDGGSGTFTNCEFMGNNATVDGAAVYVTSISSATFNVCDFINNNAKDGGAVFINGGSGTFTNCDFTGNNVTLNGGAVAISSGGSGNFTDCDFTDNNAMGSGGAVIITGGSGSFTNCDFTANTVTGEGGAVYIADDSVGTFSECNFDNNTASKSSGGAVFIKSGFGSFINCNFTKNIATLNAGVVGIESSGSGNFTDCNFMDNTATLNAGAVIISGGSGNFTDCNFTGNTATSSQGGSVYITNSGSCNFTGCDFTDNNAMISGGAVMIVEGTITFTDCDFIDNTVRDNGGAVLIYKGSATFTDCDFTGNVATADNGYAVFISTAGSGTFNGCVFNGKNEGISFSEVTVMGEGNFIDCNFTNFTITNSYKCGVVYIAGGSCNFTGCDFTDNTGAIAGAVYIDGSGNFTDCNFIGNTVTSSNGGAVYILSSGSATFTDCDFTGNTAKSNGGAVYITGGSGNFTDCDFTGNTANSYGGSVYITSSGSGNFTDCNFKDSVALKTKSVIYMTGSSSRLWLKGNSIVTGSVPIYIASGVITSDTRLVILNNKTVDCSVGSVTISAVLYDDNGNIIGSGTGVSLNVVGLKSGLTATFNRNNLNYSASYTPTAGGVYTVSGTVPSTVANNVVEYKNGTLNIIITTLNVNLTVNNTTPALDDLIQYTITVKNTGGYIANITVSDILDTSRLEFVSSSGEYSPDTGVWSITNLDSNQETTLSIVVRVKSIGEITNTVTATSTRVIDDITEKLTINVSKKTSPLVVDVLNREYGNITVNVTVPTDATGNITIKVNNRNYTGNISNGFAIIKLENITTGNYTMNVLYSGDDNYKSNSTEKRLDVIKADINPDDFKSNTEILNNTYGNVTVKVNLPADATGNVTIKVENKIYNGTLENGSAIIKLDDIAVGNYTMNVTYLGDSNYNQISVDVPLGVGYFAPDLSVSADNIIYGGNFTINVELKGINGTGITGDVKVTINNKTYTVSVVDGVGSLTVSGVVLNAGNYSVVAFYSGDANYTSTISQSSFIVHKANPVSIIVWVNNTYGTPLVIEGNYPSDATGNVTITINNQKYTEKLNNGIVTFFISGLGAGSYDLFVDYSGDNNYKADNKQLVVPVVRLSNVLNVNVYNTTYGSPLTFNITLITTNGDRLNETVILNVNGTEYTIDLVNGESIYSLPDMGAGNYTWSVTYSGDDNLTGNYKAGNVTVYQYKPALDVLWNESLVEEGNYLTFNITLSGVDNVGLNGTVKVTFDNKTEYIAIRDGVGSFTSSEPLDRNTEYELEYLFEGNQNYTANSGYKVIIVGKGSSNIQLNCSNVVYGDRLNITVKLTNIDLVENINGTVKITINNSTPIDVEVVNGTGYYISGVLDAGEYSILVVFDGDDDFTGSKSNINVVVQKSTPGLDIVVDDDLKYGSNLTGTIILKDSHDVGVEDNVVVGLYQNNTLIQSVVLLMNSTGENRFSFTGLNAGNYTIKATFDGNNNYFGNDAMMDAVIVKYTPQLNIEGIPDEYQYNKVPVSNISLIGVRPLSENISLTIIDVKTGNVVVSINVKTEDGCYYYDLPVLGTGNYTIQLFYAGDGNYNPTMLEDNFTVIKASLDSSNVETEVLNHTYGNVTVKVTVPVDATGDITISVNNRNYNGTLENGSVTIKIEDIPTGNYTMKVNYGGDGNYNPVSADELLEVNKRQLNPNDIKVTVNNTEGDVTLNITVPDDAEGDITVVVGNESYNGTIENGSAIIHIPGVDAGNHTIEINYTGDDNYNPYNKTDNITIPKADINPDNVNVTVNGSYGNSTVVVNVPDGVTGNITVVVGNESYNGTIENGSAIIHIPGVDAGDHTIEIEYSGDNNYNQFNKTDNITIPKADINPEDVNVTVINPSEGNAALEITIPGKPTGDIIITINGTDYNATLENGTAVFDLSDLGVGNYTVEIKYPGDGNYNNFNTSANITIIPNVSIISGNLVKYYRNGTQFGATFLDSTGKVLSNANVTFAIIGKFYNVTTDDNGTAVLPINLIPGNYQITSINPVTGDSVVNNITVLSTISGDDLVKYYKNGTQYTARFVNSQGEALSNTKVTFNIIGKIYNITTDENGIAVLPINLNPGKYIVTATNTVDGLMYSNNITVLSTISGDDLVKYYRNGTEYIACFLDSAGEPLSNREVSFNINGKFYNVTTDENGTAVLSVNLNPGKYIVTCINPVDGLMYSNNITVLSTILGSDVTVKSNVDGSYKVVVLDNNGNKAVNQKVTFNVNGKLTTVDSDSNGVATYNFNLKAGTYIVTAEYNGLYHSNKITVVK